MAIRKRKLRKAFFYIILKRLKTKQNKSKRRKVWVKDLFQERENKGAFHHTLQNIRVSDLHAQIQKLISGILLCKRVLLTIKHLTE